MGMFDTITIDEKLCEEFGIPNVQYQTKSLHQNLDYYYLSQLNNDGPIKLYYLDMPSTKEWWIEWDEEEKKKRNCEYSIFTEGCSGEWKEDAFNLENRNKRDMGEFPHGYVSIYNYFGNQEFYELELKFTDGKLLSIKVK